MCCIVLLFLCTIFFWKFINKPNPERFTLPTFKDVFQPYIDYSFLQCFWLFAFLFRVLQLLIMETLLWLSAFFFISGKDILEICIPHFSLDSCVWIFFFFVGGRIVPCHIWRFFSLRLSFEGISSFLCCKFYRKHCKKF